MLWLRIAFIRAATICGAAVVGLMALRFSLFIGLGFLGFALLFYWFTRSSPDSFYRHLSAGCIGAAIALVGLGLSASWNVAFGSDEAPTIFRGTFSYGEPAWWAVVSLIVAAIAFMLGDLVHNSRIDVSAIFGRTKKGKLTLGLTEVKVHRDDISTIFRATGTIAAYNSTGADVVLERVTLSRPLAWDVAGQLFYQKGMVQVPAASGLVIIPRGISSPTMISVRFEYEDRLRNKLSANWQLGRLIDWFRQRALVSITTKTSKQSLVLKVRLLYR